MADTELVQALAGALLKCRSTSRFALETFVRAVESEGVRGARLEIGYNAGEPLEAEVYVGMNGR